LDLRTALRVLEPVAEFPAETAEQLYEGAAAVPWQELLPPGQTFAVAASGRTPQLTHTHFVELKVKDAVVDALRSRTGSRPDVDPRAPKLFQVAAANGFSGRHVELMQLIADEATRAYARPLPVNATGAIGAIASELEIPWQVCRGLAVMARAIGLVAHVQEELQDPIAAEIWRRVEDESSEHLRP